MSRIDRLTPDQEARLPIPPYVYDALNEAQPDLLLWPTLIHMDAVENDWVKAAKKLGILVMAAPASFDTLTTKGAFLVRPDSLLVWGIESRDHAIKYHGFRDHQIAVTGPPHWEVYAEP